MLRELGGVLTTLALAGCSLTAAIPSPARSGIAAETPTAGPATQRADFDATCYDLLDSPGEDGDFNANYLGVLWQKYHSAGRAHAAPSRAQAVDAGGGYWVVAGVICEETSTWLAWDNAPDARHEAPYGNFLHWAEIRSRRWDGGSTPYGVEALAAALGCTA